jgi:hypothetical protein
MAEDRAGGVWPLIIPVYGYEDSWTLFGGENYYKSNLPEKGELEEILSLQDESVRKTPKRVTFKAVIITTKTTTYTLLVK